jgi:hypothetical protein
MVACCLFFDVVLFSFCIIALCLNLFCFRKASPLHSSICLPKADASIFGCSHKLFHFEKASPSSSSVWWSKAKTLVFERSLKLFCFEKASPSPSTVWLSKVCALVLRYSLKLFSFRWGLGFEATWAAFWNEPAWPFWFLSLGLRLMGRLLNIDLMVGLSSWLLFTVQRVERGNKLAGCLSFYALALLHVLAAFTLHIFTLLLFLGFILFSCLLMRVLWWLRMKQPWRLSLPPLAEMLRRSVHLSIGMPWKMSLSWVAGIIRTLRQRPAMMMSRAILSSPREIAPILKLEPGEGMRRLLLPLLRALLSCSAPCLLWRVASVRWRI